MILRKKTTVACESVTVTLWQFFLFFKFRKSSQKVVLLSGLSLSGKTLLFARLVYSKYFESCTSLKENVGNFTYEKKNIKIVDLPGEDRLRNKFFDQYKSSAKGIVYVLDSSTVQKTLRDVAESLYVILADPQVQSSRVNILVCCNKQDQTLAKSSSVVKTLLQKELNLVRRTKSNQLEDTNDVAANQTFLGNPDKDFEFSDLYNQVSFCDTTGLDSASEYDVVQLQDWMVTL
ncbi:hypothetical protein M8J77_023275 [Diaphorina citri]|nr:hypothetical protein M8J77_023275 [Diaphorina citri]